MGAPLDGVTGSAVEVEAHAAAGITGSSNLWTRLRTTGDLDAILARGYTGARHARELVLPSYTVSVDPGLHPGYFTFGRVTGPRGIDCSLLSQGPSCFALLPAGTPVALTAIPNPGAEFTGWEGGSECAGRLPIQVEFVLTRNTSCLPTFRPISGGPYPLTVAVTGPGQVWTDEGSFLCGTDAAGSPLARCGPFLETSGSAVLFHAAATDAQHAYGTAWTGDCVPAPGGALAVMDRPKSCGVEFRLLP
jgi:hypothetical protein